MLLHPSGHSLLLGDDFTPHYFPGFSDTTTPSSPSVSTSRGQKAWNFHESCTRLPFPASTHISRNEEGAHCSCLPALHPFHTHGPSFDHSIYPEATWMLCSPVSPTMREAQDPCHLQLSFPHSSAGVKHGSQHSLPPCPVSLAFVALSHSHLVIVYPLEWKGKDFCLFHLFPQFLGRCLAGVDGHNSAVIEQPNAPLPPMSFFLFPGKMEAIRWEFPHAPHSTIT